MALYDEYPPVMGATSSPWQVTQTEPQTVGVGDASSTHIVLRMSLKDGSARDYIIHKAKALKVGRDLTHLGLTERG